jgi:hypothetical protein
MIARRTLVNLLALSMELGLVIVIPPQLLARAEKGIALYNSKGCPEAEEVLRTDLEAEPWNVQAR